MANNLSILSEPEPLEKMLKGSREGKISKFLSVLSEPEPLEKMLKVFCQKIA